jgi:hypothetical protein
MVLDVGEQRAVAHQQRLRKRHTATGNVPGAGSHMSKLEGGTVNQSLLSSSTLAVHSILTPTHESVSPVLPLHQPPVLFSGNPHVALPHLPELDTIDALRARKTRRSMGNASQFTSVTSVDGHSRPITVRKSLPHNRGSGLSIGLAPNAVPFSVDSRLHPAITSNEKAHPTVIEEIENYAPEALPAIVPL